MNRETFDDLKDAYALGALSEEETREFEAYLAEHPEAQSEVDELLGLASFLALSVEDREPPKSLKRDLLATVRSEAPERSAEASRSPGTLAGLGAAVGRFLSRPAVVGALGLLLVGLISWNVLLQSEVGELRENNSELQGRIEAPEEEPSAESRVLIMDAQGEMSGVQAEVVAYEGDRAVLVAENMPEIPEDQTFQIWVVQNGEPRPGGLFDPSESSGSPVAAFVDGSLEDAEAVAVTVEPDGGSEQPTSDPQLLTEL